MPLRLRDRRQFNNSYKTIDKYSSVGETLRMRVERVEIAGGAARCTAVTEKASGIVANADISRQGRRLIVTQLRLGQDQHTDFGRVTEVTGDCLRLFNPSAIVRALTDYLAHYPTDELLAWFQSVDSAAGVASISHVAAAQQLTADAELPRRAGRPPKFSKAELIQWATVCLRLDGDEPKSLHDALAKEMSSSGQERLALSTKANARDLLRTLRNQGYLQPARKGGVHDRLSPGPNYPIGDIHP